MVDDPDYHRALEHGAEEAAEMVRQYVVTDAPIEAAEIYQWIAGTVGTLSITEEPENQAALAAELLEYWRMLHDPQYLRSIMDRYEDERGTEDFGMSWD